MKGRAPKGSTCSLAGSAERGDGKKPRARAQARVDRHGLQPGPSLKSPIHVNNDEHPRAKPAGSIDLDSMDRLSAAHSIDSKMARAGWLWKCPLLCLLLSKLVAHQWPPPSPPSSQTHMNAHTTALAHKRGIIGGRRVGMGRSSGPIVGLLSSSLTAAAGAGARAGMYVAGFDTHTSMQVD